MNLFLWVNSKSIPFKGYLFLEPEEELILCSENPLEVPLFFEKIETLIRKGFYAFGFFSYELGYLLEKRLYPLYRKPETPLAHFIFFKKRKTLKIYPLKLTPSFKVLSCTLNLEREEYYQAISKIRDYIASGDTYQVNFTGKFKFLLEGYPWQIFHYILFSQRCEYACFFQAKDYIILSFSPELFIRKRGKEILSSPMKGTEKRAPLLKFDEAQKIFLKRDEKTQAENLMIVDLIRNDLGRISKVGSVEVSQLFKIKTYPTLHQMISTIKGTFPKGTKLFEIFKALFPCGSVTGAPKIRTMEIIKELEKEPRNVYTGAIGFITPKGNFIFNVAIRTLLLKPLSENLYQGELGVGAGIVWDSSPEKEFEETKLKAHFFLSPLPYFELFETFLWRNKPLRLKLHYKRLLNSLNFFKFNIPKELETYRNFTNFLEKNLKTKEHPFRVKLVVSPHGKIRLESSPIETPSWGKDLKVGFIKRKTPKNLFHFHKTTFREEYDHYRKRLNEFGFTEILFYNEDNFLLEGTISNIFLKVDNLFLTPPLDFGILPGVLREEMLKKGLAKEYPLKIEDLKKGELYIGNSLRGLGKVKDWVIL